MRKLWVVTLMGFVSACTQTMIWDKPGATQADFNRDDYNCRKDAIASGGTTYVGFGVTARNADTDMYQRCMVAAGYSARRGDAQAVQSNANTDGEAALRSLRERQQRVCADPKFQPYYSKTACLVPQITFEQVADTSKISPAAKAIFVELRNEIDRANLELSELLQKYGGARGAKQHAYYMATQKAQNDKNNLDLFNGQITWGDYNKRRQQIYSDGMEATK